MHTHTDPSSLPPLPPELRKPPSIGRIVHFHEEGGPYAAFVTAVNEDGSIDLATLGRNSLYFQHGIHEAPSFPPVKGSWTWPPRV